MKFMFSCLLILSLVGCMHTYAPLATPESDPAAIKMTEIADQVNDSLRTLEAIKKADSPHYRKKLSEAGYCLTQGVSVDWTGPIEPLVRQMAKAAGYRLRVLGPTPPVSVIVTVSEKNTTIGKILRDADLQAGSKADIAIYPSKHVIELRYKSF